MLKSIEHKDYPNPNGKFVRANVLISGFVFLTDPNGGSKVVRIVQV